MITVIEQNIRINFCEMQDIHLQQARVAKFDCSWEEYINSYITESALVGIGLGKEEKYSGYSFSRKYKVIDLKYDERTLFCILKGYVSLYRFATLVEES